MRKKSLLIILIGSLLVLWLSLPPFSWKITDRFIVPLKPPLLYKEPKLGLDLRGGTRLVFELDTKKLSEGTAEEAAKAARDIIERRINFFGVSEPNITMVQIGDVRRIYVELPGVSSADDAVSLIGQTAQLDFREYKEREVKTGTQSAMMPFFEKTTLTGSLLSRASVDFNQETGKPQVLIVFNNKGKDLFATITKKNIKKPLAIFLDNTLITSPIVQDEIRDGTAVISGDFSLEEARRLVNALNAGALPVPITLLERSTVSATVGVENIQKSIIAGIVGITSVIFFMILIYRINGVLSVITLALYGLITLVIYQYSGIVLTLSGIAGLFLSIGMAVDANILIYERIKEERYTQKDNKIAVRVGFGRALTAIREANINTFLIAVVLFNPFNFPFLPLFGSVRGFAATLALGVLVGYFTGVVITKNILWVVYGIDKKND